MSHVVKSAAANVAAKLESAAADGVVDSRPVPELREGPLVQLCESDLVVRSQQGDTAAYSELIGRYQFAVRNLARGMVRDFQDAEDLAQDTFIKAFTSLQNLKEANKFGPWLFTILRHSALDFLRSNKQTVSLENMLEDGFEPAQESSEGAGVAMLESHEEEQRTLEALRSLRADYREVIVLKHVEKLSYKEISKRLNMSVSAVGEKLSRVRGLLKRRIEKQPIKPRPGSLPLGSTAFQAVDTGKLPVLQKGEIQRGSAATPREGDA
jgi:RNA polymerase sigma-70 factor (ECF subfamily)